MKNNRWRLPALLMLVMLLIPLSAAGAQSTDSCRYINPDGSTTGELYVSLEGCAQAVLDETLRIGQSEGIGLYGDYALRVNNAGEVYAASTVGATSVDQLTWQFLGTIAVNAPAPVVQPTAIPARTQPSTSGSVSAFTMGKFAGNSGVTSTAAGRASDTPRATDPPFSCVTGGGEPRWCAARPS